MLIYIGKVGVLDMDMMKLIIIDWWVFVVSMFYLFIGGDELVFY